jgi:hypothetical protein
LDLIKKINNCYYAYFKGEYKGCFITETAARAWLEAQSTDDFIEKQEQEENKQKCNC